MGEYHKINTIFKRDDKTKKLLIEQYSQPEFEYLANNEFEWSEKIDGTNCRAYWNHEDETVQIKGRTDNAQMPMPLIERLQTVFDKEKLKSLYSDVSITFYGEGYGRKIQAIGSKYKADGVDFILFDVRVGRWWLERKSVDKIAKDLEIQSVPIIGKGTLSEAVAKVEKGFNSIFGDFMAEGMVLRPTVELFARNGSRIIAKLKHRDFLSD